MSDILANTYAKLRSSDTEKRKNIKNTNIQTITAIKSILLSITKKKECYIKINQIKRIAKLN